LRPSARPWAAARGCLSGRHPADLLSEVLAAVVARAGVEPGEVDDVIVGCLDQVGEQSINIPDRAPDVAESRGVARFHSRPLGTVLG
jgi:acetyl-CoA acetyltransferase